MYVDFSCAYLYKFLVEDIFIVWGGGDVCKQIFLLSWLHPPNMTLIYYYLNF